MGAKLGQAIGGRARGGDDDSRRRQTAEKIYCAIASFEQN